MSAAPVNPTVKDSTQRLGLLARLLPRSLPGLVAAGCLLTAIPTLIALLVAGSVLDRLSRSSEVLVSEGLSVVHASMDLRDHLQTLERNSRQYLALREPALLDLVGSRWQETDQVLQSLEGRPMDAELETRVMSLRQDFDIARAEWSEEILRANSVEHLAALDGKATGVIAGGRQAIDQRVEELHGAAQNANGLMFLSILALIPLTVLLTYGFSRAVAKPLRELSGSIADLGHSSYDRPIRIAYPQEMQRLGSQLDWLRRRLARLEVDKDRFLQHVSHELKTPLASLSEGAQLLSEGKLGQLSPRQAEVTQILCDSAAELESSISTLLTYAEWRAERQHMESEWFDPRRLIEEILGAHRLPMARRRLKVKLQMQGETIYGQRSRLRSALDNLITNAIKHAPEGSIIEIGAAGRGSQCEISVRDYGDGVPEHEKEKIFEPFVRGSTALENGIRGTGVGLSIVKETILAHGGEVHVENAQPGARFRLRWPGPAAEVGSRHD